MILGGNMNRKRGNISCNMKTWRVTGAVICLAAVMIVTGLVRPMTARASDGGLLSGLGDLIAMLGDSDSGSSTGKKADDSSLEGLMGLIGQLAEGQVPIREATVSKIADQTYTGKEIKPVPKLTRDGITLKRGTDYSLSYSNNIKVGTGKIKITGKGQYKGTKTVSFKIVKEGSSTSKKKSSTGASSASAKEGKFTVKPSKNSYIYNGEAQKPSVKVTIRGKSVPSSGYTVSYKDNKNVGTATITVTGKGEYKNYTGTAEFKITLKSPAFISVKSEESGQISLEWGKDGQADGYQIQYSDDKSFTSKVRKVMVDSNATVSASIGKLTPGGKYYVRIRAFKKGASRNTYGPFGKIRTVTVKK